jgi:HAD superfamily hydrolase (TIGR01549 family)
VVANFSPAIPFRALKAVAFDLDDTLFDRRAALSLLLEKWTGSKPDPGRILMMNLAAHERFLIQLSVESEGTVDPRHMVRRFHAEFSACVTPDPQALGTLERLQVAGIPLGLLSNGTPGMQLAKLRACGADRFFPLRRRVFSSCIGMMKPEPGAFRELARRMGVDPSEILFVGDDPLRDIEGARAAGMMACQLFRPGRERVADIPVIESLAELPDLIALSPE